jgi:hypothetical protein
MTIYSYRGNFPELLPDRVRLDDGYTRTSLEKLSLDELKEIGFSDPIEEPIYDLETQELFWDGKTLTVVEKKIEKKLSYIDDFVEQERENILKNIKENPSLVGMGFTPTDIYSSIEEVPPEYLQGSKYRVEL